MEHRGWGSDTPIEERVDNAHTDFRLAILQQAIMHHYWGAVLTSVPSRWLVVAEDGDVSLDIFCNMNDSSPAMYAVGPEERGCVMPELGDDEPVDARDFRSILFTIMAYDPRAQRILSSKELEWDYVDDEDTYQLSIHTHHVHRTILDEEGVMVERLQPPFRMSPVELLQAHVYLTNNPSPSRTVELTKEFYSLGEDTLHAESFFEEHAGPGNTPYSRVAWMRGHGWPLPPPYTPEEYQEFFSATLPGYRKAVGEDTVLHDDPPEQGGIEEEFMADNDVSLGDEQVLWFNAMLQEKRFLDALTHPDSEFSINPSMELCFTPHFPERYFRKRNTDEPGVYEELPSPKALTTKELVRLERRIRRAPERFAHVWKGTSPITPPATNSFQDTVVYVRCDPDENPWKEELYMRLRKDDD